MAFTLTRSTISAASSTSVNTVYGGTPTTGALLIATVFNQSSLQVPTVSDSNGNWTLLDSLATASRFIGHYGLIAVASQPTIVNATRGGADTLSMNIYEFAGGPATLTGLYVPTSAPSGTTQATGTTTAGAQPAIIAERQNSLILCSLGVGASITSPTFSDGTFTAGQAGPSGALRIVDFYKLAGTLGTTYNGSFSWTTSRVPFSLYSEFCIRQPGIMI